MGLVRDQGTGRSRRGLPAALFLILLAGQASAAPRALTFSSNPVRCDTDCSVTMTFVQGPSGTLRVYDLLGHIRVERPLTAGSGATQFTWDLSDDSGNDVASGIYRVVLIQPGGALVVGRLMVIR